MGFLRDTRVGCISNRRKPPEEAWGGEEPDEGGAMRGGQACRERVSPLSFPLFLGQAGWLAPPPLLPLSRLSYKLGQPRSHKY